MFVCCLVCLRSRLCVLCGRLFFCLVVCVSLLFACCFVFPLLLVGLLVCAFVCLFVRVCMGVFGCLVVSLVD